jgi:hypothetical protein
VYDNATQYFGPEPKWTKKRGAAQMGCWLGRRGSGYNRSWTGGIIN